MITDAKLYFDTGATAITTDRVTSILDVGDIEDMGKTGSPLYINVFLATAFSSDTECQSVVLVASSGADPGTSDVVMTLIPLTAASALKPAKLLGRFPLPMERLKGMTEVALAYVGNGTTAAGKIKAFISL